MIKKLFSCIASVLILASAVAQKQTNVILPEQYRNAGIEVPRCLLIFPINKELSLVKSSFQEEMGETYWDLHSHSVTREYKVMFDNSAQAGVWTKGEDAPEFPDLGIGYSYKASNGTWQPPSNSLFEGLRVAGPSIARWGENGEIVSAHAAQDNNTGIHFNRREQNGEGQWIPAVLKGPDGHEDLKWAHMMTAGTGNEIIHVLALTPPVQYGGSSYNGQNGAIVYSRSNDGGESWEIKNHSFEELGSSQYTGFSPDTYTWLKSSGQKIAFVVSDEWHDLILMQSDDFGNSWEKTIIWEHPYPLWDGEETEAFYCPDGSFSGLIDENGKAHVAFGITRVKSNGNNEIMHYPFIDGIGYWNEDRAMFSNKLNTLNPYDHEDSELYANYNLIGWVMDINENGQWVSDLVCDEPECIGQYYQGAVSMPLLRQMPDGRLLLVYSGIHESFHTENQNYRHLFTRYSGDGNGWSNLERLTANPSWTFSECVYPTTVIDGIWSRMSLQVDNEPGLAMIGDEDPFIDNQYKTLLYEPYWNPYHPPGNFQATVEEYDVYLEWDHPPYDLHGYNIYRDGVKINEELIIEENYQDLDVEEGTHLYGVTSVIFDQETYASHTLVEVGTNDIQDLSQDAISIYPNPSNDYTKITSDVAVKKIEVYGSSGIKLKEIENIGAENHINTSTLSNGIYIIRIHINQAIINKKLVVR